MKIPPKIIVEGMTNSGKTTVSQIIQKALADYGIGSVITNEDSIHPERNILEKSAKLKGQTLIIEQRQINNKSIN